MFIANLQTKRMGDPLLACFSMLSWSPGLHFLSLLLLAAQLLSLGLHCGSPFSNPEQHIPCGNLLGSFWGKTCWSRSLRVQVGLRSIKDAAVDLILSGQLRIDLGHRCQGVTSSCV